MAPRGNTNQIVATPEDLLVAIVKRFGHIDLDLAANASNAVVPRHLGPGGLIDDALSVASWAKFNSWGLAFLNPPFANVAPWVERAARSRQLGMRVAVLVQASVCTDWFLQHVQPHAYTFALTPRPWKREVRDVALAMFEPAGYRGHEPWEWKKTKENT